MPPEAYLEMNSNAKSNNAENGRSGSQTPAESGRSGRSTLVGIDDGKYWKVNGINDC